MLNPTKFCNKSQKCLNCGEEHEAGCKESNPKCCQCSGNHKSDRQSCIKYTREVEILQLKALNGLTLTEDRRIAKNEAKSYANMKSETRQTSKEDVKAIIHNGNKELIEVFQLVLKKQEDYFKTVLDYIIQKIENIVT